MPELGGRPSQGIVWRAEIAGHTLPEMLRFRYKLPAEMQNRVMGGLRDLDRYPRDAKQLTALGDKFTLRLTAQTPRRLREVVIHFEVK